MGRNSPPCSSAAPLHGPLHRMIDGADGGHDFQELDPSGRYGRYRDVLGTGAFKVVYKGFDVVDGIEVAWNQIKVHNALHNAEDIDRFYCEVHLLKSLKHKNIIKFYHSWVDIEAMNINFLTEIFTSGTLRQYQKRHKFVDIRAIKNWSRQILRGLLYLHSQDPPVIHRDMKCDNIFINGNQGEVKIGDLGLATILNQSCDAQTVMGTPEFMAPELYEEQYTELVDIYSFGMCLLEMVTGKFPYSECSSAAQIYKKVTSGIKPKALDKVKNLELYQFVKKCIAPASRRLPARELLLDSFLQDEEVHDIQTSFMKPNVERSESFARLRTTISLPIKHQGNAVKALAPDSGLVCAPLARQNSIPTAYSVKLCQHCAPVLQSTGEVVSCQTLDFQIKGKQFEDGTVQLHLRLVDTEGEVRTICFPYDVVHDTALSVASEMVEELEIVNEDVAKIAELIDKAINILVPSLCSKQISRLTDSHNDQGVSNPDWLCETSLKGLCPEETQNTTP